MRQATAEDVPAIAGIEQLVSPDGSFSAAQFERACAPQSAEQVLVCGSPGEATGFVVFSLVLDEGNIHNISVHPGQQGKGLGAALLSAAMAQMRLSGVRRCLLEVRESNRAARALYQRAGFTVDGTRRNYYRTAAGREDALLLSLAL